MLGAAAIMGAATSYPVADRRRVRLDQAARDALVAEGKAQTFVQTSKGFLHVRVAGPETGQVVILVHGGIVGGQASARPDVAYTREFYLLQLREQIDELGIDGPVNLAGASFGGIVVAEFAAENPGDVASMALMAPAGLGRGGLVSPILSWPMIERILNSLRHYDFGWRPDVFEALGRSGIPVFTAWGTDDAIHPYERTQVLQRYVTQTTLVTLDGAGHAITYGRAEQVLAGYGQFLRDSAR
jgi:pimeloyl-ACP methyl ester carboxylesterase